MEVIVSNVPVDDQECDVLVTGFFEDERPLQGWMGWIDWRFNGKLSRFVLEGKLSGAWKETTLMPGEGRILPRMALLLGCGSAEAYSTFSVRELACHLVKTLRNMEASRVCLAFPCGEGTRVDCGKGAEVVLQGFADGLGENPIFLSEGWVDRLHLFFSAGERDIDEILWGIQAGKSVLEKRFPVRVLVLTRDARMANPMGPHPSGGGPGGSPSS